MEDYTIMELKYRRKELDEKFIKKIEFGLYDININNYVSFNLSHFTRHGAINPHHRLDQFKYFFYNRMSSSLYGHNNMVPFRYLLFLFPGLLICPNVALLFAWWWFSFITPMLLRLLYFTQHWLYSFCGRSFICILCLHIYILHATMALLSRIFISMLCPWAYWISLNIYIVFVNIFN